MGSTARTAALLIGVNSKIVVYYFQRLREIIYLHNGTSEQFAGEVKVDESYFGGSRKGKHSRGAAGKVPVFGLLKLNSKVYIVMTPDAKIKTLVSIIKRKSETRQHCLLLFILIFGVIIMHLMSQSLNTIVLTIVNFLLTSIITLMELRIF